MVLIYTFDFKMQIKKEVINLKAEEKTNVMRILDSKKINYNSY